MAQIRLEPFVSAALDPIPRDRMAQGRAALAAGDPVQAANLFHEAAQADPVDWESRYWLSSALTAAGEPALAAQTLDDARNLHGTAAIRAAGADMARLRGDKAYCREIGMKFYAAKLMAAASVCLGRGLDFDNLEPESFIAYGLALQHQGRMKEATDVFTAASEVFSDAEAQEYLL